MNHATKWIRSHALSPSTDHLVWATVAVSVLLLLLACATLYLTAQGRLGDARANRSDEIRSCSSSFSAELVTGPTALALKALAEGLVIDHLCQNKSCCNPAHLEPVTSGENTRRYHAQSRVRVSPAVRPLR